MAIASLNYTPPIRRSSKTKPLDYERLEAAVALYNEGRHREALHQTLMHLFPTHDIPDLAVETFRFTQGSSRVSACVENDELRVSVPLVSLPTGGNTIAALRYVLTRISGSGQLHQPRLNGDDVHIEFRGEVSRLHPTKVLEVLRRLPAEADDNDDWLIRQFGAIPLERESVAALTPDELAAAEALWRRHWNDVEALLEESRRKRSLFFLNEVTAYAIYRIGFALPLCGFLSARLRESASTFNDTDVEPLKRETSLSKCAKEMAAVSRSELEQSLGHAEYALTRLSEGSPAGITNYFGPGRYSELVDQHRTSGKTMDAALALIGTYNFLLARFYWPEVIEAEMRAGLAMVSDKPWREAANLLWEHSRTLAAKYGDDDEDDEDDEDDDGDDDEGAGNGLLGRQRRGAGANAATAAAAAANAIHGGGGFHDDDEDGFVDDDDYLQGPAFDDDEEYGDGDDGDAGDGEPTF
jgi:hypothetical protein